MQTTIISHYFLENNRCRPLLVFQYRYHRLDFRQRSSTLMQLVNLLETTRNQQQDKIIVQSDKMNIVWKLGLIVVSLGFAFFVDNKIQND